MIADALKFARDAAGEAPVTEIVVDDRAAVAVGAWSLGVGCIENGGFCWGDSMTYKAAGSGAATLSFTPALPAAGRYKVYARWTQHAIRASDAPFTVHHAAGATTLRVNQEGGGGDWYYLGSYDLAPGQNHRVVLSDDADEMVSGDAVRFLLDPGAVAGAEIVVDDRAAAASGAWSLGVGCIGDGGLCWGDSIHYKAAGNGAATLSFTPTLPEAGFYNVYARWTRWSSVRASDAPFTVHHAAGATTLRFDQHFNGGEWILLGRFELTPGLNHRVVLSDDADDIVVADAVKFLRAADSRAVVADAIKLVATAPAADFTATAATLLREYITLNGQPLALIEGGQILTVHPDHLGSPQKMTDSTGALVWDAVYRPFGAAHSITGTAANDQRFPGQLHDVETSFHYNYFRDYDPSLGRYVESDPIGLDGGLGTYLYAKANPLRFIDPFGLAPAPSGNCSCVVICSSNPFTILVACATELTCVDDCGNETVQYWSDWYFAGPERGFNVTGRFSCDEFPGPLPNKPGPIPPVPGIIPPDPKAPSKPYPFT